MPKSRKMNVPDPITTSGKNRKISKASTPAKRPGVNHPSAERRGADSCSSSAPILLFSATARHTRQTAQQCQPGKGQPGKKTLIGIFQLNLMTARRHLQGLEGVV